MKVQRHFGLQLDIRDVKDQEAKTMSFCTIGGEIIAKMFAP